MGTGDDDGGVGKNVGYERARKYEVDSLLYGWD